jgi:phosphopentomutase
MGNMEKMNPSAVDKVLDFLFRKPVISDNGEESQFLDTRTDISNREVYSTIMYYRLLQEQYSCDAAGKIADIIERLAISNNRMGRLEGVNILKQELPKKEMIIRGIAKGIEELEATE